MRNKAQIDDLKREIKDLEFKLAVAKAVLLRLDPTTAKEDVKTSSKNKPPRRNSLASQAQEILTESQKPMSIPELADAMIKRGFAKEEEQEKLKAQTPSALSRRKDIFVLVGKSIYDLVSRKKDVV